jgi:hypothetical protein
MKKYEGKLVGILGTIIVHLVAAIIFISFKIGSLHNEMNDLVEVEYAPEEVLQPEKQENTDDKQATTVDKILQGDQEMLNIAKNLASKGNPKINKSDYIDEVKEELIKSGKLGRDNYIDEQKRLSGQKDEDVVPVTKEDTTPDKPDKLQEMEANYKGPTRIYYNLPGRVHTYLPIPIYKCEGAGKVVLSIEVDPEGTVEKALIIENQSTTTDPCLVETAISTALVSHFNSNIKAPKIQTGTLTYHFVAQ